MKTYLHKNYLGLINFKSGISITLEKGDILSCSGNWVRISQTKNKSITVYPINDVHSIYYERIKT